jgi:hypothetical protein
MSKNDGKKRKSPWARDYEIIGVGSFQVLPCSNSSLEASSSISSDLSLMDNKKKEFTLMTSIHAPDQSSLDIQKPNNDVLRRLRQP